jgi:ATP-dependent DNA ligase
LSRNRKPLETAYPELVGALETSVRGNAILDGEVVAIDPGTGQPSFSLLQRRMGIRDVVAARRSGVPVVLYLFDCLFYEGVNLTALPLLDRKAVLRDVVWFDDRVRFTPFKATGSDAMYREACARGAEGIIAKRAASSYTGTRSADWLKLKCVTQQEFVVGGFTDPKGDRDGFGALLVGYYDAWCVVARITRDWRHHRRRHFRPHGGSNRRAFCLRHPRFIGIRSDKAPEGVTREAAVTSPRPSRPASPRSRP